jgi:hypothetical protein
LSNEYLQYLSTLCSAEITFKTDPKNTDYQAEHGASRNFEPWRDEEVTQEEDRLAKLEEEENNPMKVLENRTSDSKREMDILDALQDIRARNARNERVATGQETVDLIERLGKDEVEDEEEREKRLAEEEDEKLVKAVFSKIGAPKSATTNGESSSEGGPPVITVKRKAEGDEPDVHTLLSDSARSILENKSLVAPMAKKKKVNSLGIKIVKGKGKSAAKA